MIEEILTGGEIKVFSVCGASIAIQEVLLPPGHTFLISFDTLVAMDVPGIQVETS